MAKNQKLLAWLLLFLLTFIWGSSFFFIKKALIAFSWKQVAVLRMTISMLVFFPVLIPQILKLNRSKWLPILGLAIIGNGFPMFLYPLAQTKIDSSLAGILNALTPLFVFIFGVLFFKVQLIRRKLFGVLIGFLGAALLIGGQTLFGGTNNWYAIFAVVASIFYGMNSNLIKTYLQDVPAVASNGIAFLMIGIPASIYLFSTNFIEVMKTHPDAYFSLGSVAILSVMGTALAMILFVKLVQLTSALFSSMVAYLMPITAIFIGFLDGETITEIHFIGMGLIFTGVYLASERLKGR